MLSRDSDTWTQKIQTSHVLLVGVEHVSRSSQDTAGISPRERAIVAALAKRLGAKVQYREGNLLELMHATEEREVPVLAAEVRTDSPYVKGVSLSTPYGEVDGVKRCIVVAPGQNKLLAAVNDVIASSGKRGG